MAGGVIIPGEDDELFQEPILNGDPLGFSDAEPVDGTGGFMDDDAFQTIIGKGIEAAENFVDTWLSPEREKAARYYDGEPFGNELDDRSQVVLTETRDAILAMLPGLLRIFCGTTDAVAFEPNPGTPSEQADQQTKYVSHVIMRDNPGFTIIHDAIKDALLKKTGVLTWWWEEKEDVTATRFTDLPADALTLLQLEATDRSDADVGLEYHVEIEDTRPDETQPSGDLVPDLLADATPEDKALAGQPTPVLSSGIVRRRVLRRRVRVAAVPPEEFITTPQNTNDLDAFQLIGRRSMKTMSELVALGHDEGEIRDALGGQGDTHANLEMNPEQLQRNQGAGYERLFDAGFEAQDPASELVKYCVIYALVDYDGDGIAERRKICTVGPHYHIIYNEIYDDDMVPFGTLCPDPEAHSPYGGSVFDWTKDIQEINSEVARGVLDSLSESISGQRAVNSKTVRLDDALNPARGALIRVDGDPNGAVVDLAKPFVGGAALPVLQYMGEVKTRRTGTNPAAPSAIDADALQSTATAGVQAAVDASQERIEMIARIFAETGFSRLARGVRNLVVRHQDYRRTLRLMGNPVTVDPRTWVADLDLVSKVGIGHGMGAKKLAGLQFMFQQQMALITNYGVQNPVVQMEEFSYTLHEMARELGFSDPTRFAKAYTPEMQQKAEQMENAIRSQPTPQQLLYQAQTQKTQAELAARLAALAEKRDAALRQDATKHHEINTRFALEAAKLYGQFGQQAEKQAETLRQEAREDAHTLADDLNAASPEPAPTPIPAPQPPQPPQGDNPGA